MVDIQMAGNMWLEDGNGDEMVFYPKSLLNGSPIVSPAKCQVYLEITTNVKYKAYIGLLNSS